MTRARLLGLTACVAGVALGLGILGHPSSRGATSAARVTGLPGTPAKIRSTADAVAALTALEARSHVGLTASDIAKTDLIYRFGSARADFTTGLGVYRTPFEATGFCLTFAAGTSCTRVPPSRSEPLIGLALDLDAERAGEPFVVVSVTAPGVTSVTYTCADATYPATLSGGVAAFVAPSSDLRADDCVGNARFADGHVVSKRV